MDTTVAKMHTDYSLADLRKIAREAFTRESAKYPRGQVVGLRDWILRVRNASTVLVLTLTYKQPDGWQDREYTIVL